MTKQERYRVFVFSILKCEFGWGGIIPDGCDANQWEQKIICGFGSNCKPHSIAQVITDDIYKNKGSFRKRADGKPNTRLPTQMKQEGQLC